MTLGIRSETSSLLDGDNKYYPLWSRRDNGVTMSGQGADQLNPALNDDWRGRWVQFRMHYDLSENDNDSSVQMWIDGVLSMDNTTLNAGYPNAAQETLTRGMLFGNAKAGFAADTNVYVDDFKMYTEDPQWRDDGLYDPEASFTVSPTTDVDTATEVSFTDTSTDFDGSIASWSWSFGDGESSTLQHPTHTYATAGTYTASLTVTDNDGLVSEAEEKSIVVSEAASAMEFFADGFESGDMTHTNANFAWTTSASAVVSTEKVHSGNYALKFSFAGDPAVNPGAVQRFAFTEGQTELWTEYWVYFPDGTEGLGAEYLHRYPGTTQHQQQLFELYGPATNQMTLGIRSETSSLLDGDNKYYPLWSRRDNGVTMSGQGADQLNPALNDDWRGRWVQFRMHYDLSENDNDSSVQMWIDGVLSMDNTTLNAGYPNAAQETLTRGMLFGSAKAGFAADTNVYVDDFKMYTEDPQWEEDPEEVTTSSYVDPDLIINECNVMQGDWIYCDDFEDRNMNEYYDYFNRFGRYQIRSGVFGRGMEDSRGLLSWFGYYDSDTEGPHGTWAKLAFGNTPDNSFYKPVGDTTKTNRDLYWRFYVKSNTGVDPDTGEPLLNLSGTGPLARIYGMGPDDTPFMEAEIAYPDQTGKLTSTLYGGMFDSDGNPIGLTSAPLAELQGDTPVMQPLPMATGPWYEIQVHVKLNEPGASNGVYELWVDGELESSASNLDWIGDYTAYGLNVVELYNNNQQAGVTGGDTENRVIDNMVLSMAPIGEAGVPQLNNANLTMMHNSIGKMTPGFEAAVTDYTVRLESGVSDAVVLTPTLSDPLASLTVDGAPHASGEPATISGDTIVMEVLAQDGTTTKTYTIHVAHEQAFLTNECAQAKTAWLFCDDFESDRFDQYFERTRENQFAQTEGVGIGGSTGMKAEYRVEDGEMHDTGALKLAVGRTPSDYLKPVAAEGEDLTEIYSRFYVKFEEDWIGGGAAKMSRISSFQNEEWAQSMAALIWSGANPEDPYLYAAPESGTDEAGVLMKRFWNDFEYGRYMAGGHTETPLFDEDHVGSWYAVEAHVKLNDPGLSNGIFELWIDDVLEVGVYNVNWIGAYEIGPDAGYALNFVSMENYWNAGTPVDQERYFDNWVVSREKIGLATAASEEEPAAPIAEIRANKTELQQGEDTELLLGAASLTEPASILDMTLHYDPAVLSFDTETSGGSVMLADSAIETLLPNLTVASAVKEAEGNIRLIVMSSGEPISGTHNVVKLIAHAKSDAATEGTIVSLSDASGSFDGGELQVLDTASALLELEVTTAVDLSALESAISVAQQLYNAAETGTEPGQYPAADKANLLNAINAAIAVRDNVNVSFEEAEAAAAALNAAVSQFQSSVIAGEPADLTTLQAAISTAQSKSQDAVIGSKIGQYSSEAKAALDAAISAAIAVRDQAGVSQAAVDAAVADLNAAVSQFASSLNTLVEGASQITIRDLSIIAKYLGTTSGDADWADIAAADLFDNGEITIQTLAAVAQMILDEWLKA